MAFKRNQKGFTIVELMIAISVFSIAVLLVTMGVLVISRQYQQGTTRTKLESANREIHQNISQAVQYSGANTQASTETDWNAFCAGTQRFVYGKVIVAPGTYDAAYYKNTLKAGLYADTVQNDTCPLPSVNGTPIGGAVGSGPNLLDRDNLLPDGAKVVTFSYDTTSKMLTTKFVLSDFDLLNLGTADEINCKTGVAGKEFCAVVQLQSSAIRRINN
jgi:prepilin-type N-terminal cleavage/methylation domain-containing protein